METQRDTYSQDADMLTLLYSAYLYQNQTIRTLKDPISILCPFEAFAEEHIITVRQWWRAQIWTVIMELCLISVISSGCEFSKAVFSVPFLSLSNFWASYWFVLMALFVLIRKIYQL